MKDYCAIIGNRLWHFTAAGDSAAMLKATKWLAKCSTDGEFTACAPCELECELAEFFPDDDDDARHRSVGTIAMFLKAPRKRKAVAR